VFWPTADQSETDAFEGVVLENSPSVVAEPAKKLVASIEPEAIKPVEVAAEKAKTLPEIENIEVVAEKVQQAVIEQKAVQKIESKVVEQAIIAQSKGETIKVTAHFGNVRNAPDNSGKVISRLKKGETVYKLDEKNGWFQVRLADAKTAWVHRSIFAPRLQVGVDVANIRSKPTAKGSIITRLKKGDYVTKTGEQKSWYQVKLDSVKTA